MTPGDDDLDTRDAGSARDGDPGTDDESPGIADRLRETFGTGSLTGGSVTGGTGGTGGLGTGAGDMSGGARRDGDVTTGGDDGADTTGSGPFDTTDED